MHYIVCIYVLYMNYFTHKSCYLLIILKLPCTEYTLCSYKSHPFNRCVKYFNSVQVYGYQNNSKNESVSMICILLWYSYNVIYFSHSFVFTKFFLQSHKYVILLNNIFGIIPFFNRQMRVKESAGDKYL